MKMSLSLAEFKQCAKILEASTGRPMPRDQAEAYLLLLQDIPFRTLFDACVRSVQEAEQGFIPAVGRIRALAAEALQGILPQAGDEWPSVLKAVRKFGYLRPGEAIRSLSPRAAKAVEAVGWAAICDSENISIQCAQFRMAYEAAAKSEVGLRRISENLRPRIEPGGVIKNLANKMGVPK